LGSGNEKVGGTKSAFFGFGDKVHAEDSNEMFGTLEAKSCINGPANKKK